MSLPIITHPEQDNTLLKRKQVSLCAFLDTVRIRKDNTYTVRLRIVHNRQAMYYSCNISMSESQYKSLMARNTKGEINNFKIHIYLMLKKAYTIICAIDKFSFDEFAKQWKGEKPTDQKDLKEYYESIIDDFKRNNQLGTASNYFFSYKSLVDFYGKSNLQFKHISSQFLKDYERHMVEDKQRSRTTVSMYLRALKAIYNTAILDKAISIDIYPFGKRKYQVPAPKSVKKALTSEELKILFECNPPTPEQRKARDFFFFSYSCNGMNFKDIALIKYANISDKILTFGREKTKNTDNTQMPVIVYLSDFAISVIETYGNPDKHPTNYVFDIVNQNAQPAEQYRQLKNFIRFTNQHLKKLAKDVGVTPDISTYFARHSYATTALRKGASIEYISEALNHSDMKTTKNYLAGFADDVKKEFAKKIMEF